MELRAELEKPTSDRAKINRYVKEINDLRGTLLTKKIDNVIEVKKVLDPDQFTLLKQKLEDRRQFRKDILKRWMENHIEKSI
jgi:Spy/CpxP family protein refolding chaperone